MAANQKHASLKNVLHESDKGLEEYGMRGKNSDDRFVILPDGRTALAGHQVQDMLTDFTLPNYRAEKEGAKQAIYTAVPVANAFAVGKDLFPMVDGTAWTEPINAYLRTRGDLIPLLPMVAGLIGPLGTGKTLLAIHLLDILFHAQGFIRLHIMSPTAKTDPTIANWMRTRNPDGEVTVHTGIDPEVMRYCFYRAQKETDKWFKLGEESIYSKTSVQANSVKKDQQQFDSIAHPWTNDEGMPHGRKPNLPPAVEKNPKEHDPLSHVAMGGHRKRKAEDLEDELHLTNNEIYVASRRRAISSNYSQGQLYTQRMIVPVTRVAPCVDPRTSKSTNPINNTPSYHNTMKASSKRICLNKMTLQAIVRQVQLDHSTRDRQFDGQLTALRLRNERAYLDVEDCVPTLIWLDDIMDLIHHHAAMLPMMRKWICNLRHGRMACMWGVQRIKGIDPTFRTNSTHYMIFQIRNEGERRTLAEELANVVTGGDFEELLHAATKPMPGRERDFLYLDIRNQIAGRSFEYQITGTTAKVSNAELNSELSCSYEHAKDMASTTPKEIEAATSTKKRKRENASGQQPRSTKRRR